MSYKRYVPFVFLKLISKRVILCCLFASAAMGAEKVPPKAKNVLLLCIDDLRPELNCFGASYIHSPNIDRLAAAGRSFHRHYVNAPSCGPSRYTLMTGLYGSGDNGNQSLFARADEVAKDQSKIPPCMPEYFSRNGYITVSVGKVTHHPGGRGGTNWDDDAIEEIPRAWDRHLMPSGSWQHPKGAMHGLAHGNIRIKADEHDVMEAAEGPDTIYPDGLIAQEGIKQLEELAAGDKPFFLAIGLIKPHLPFGAPKKYLDLYDGVEFPAIAHPDKPDGETTWHKSGEFMKYNRWGKDPREDQAFATQLRKHYAACVSYADKHVGDILAKLKETAADKNTIIVLWGDHGWHLGEHSIWGKHSLFEESLLSPLIIVDPGMAQAGHKSMAIVETLDIFPTLCDLVGQPKPSFVQGKSLANILKNPQALGHAAIGYQQDASTIRTATHRLISHKKGTVELYDHTSPEKETVNIAAQNPKLVEKLKQQLDKQWQVKSFDVVSLKEAHEGSLEIDLRMFNQFSPQPREIQDFYTACRTALTGENPDKDLAAVCQQFKRLTLGGPMLGDITEKSVSLWMHLPEPATILVDVKAEGGDVAQ
ncbi:sulfatase, partial [Planctomycetota bacterium]